MSLLHEVKRQTCGPGFTTDVGNPEKRCEEDLDYFFPFNRQGCMGHFVSFVSVSLVLLVTQ